KYAVCYLVQSSERLTCSRRTLPRLPSLRLSDQLAFLFIFFFNDTATTEIYTLSLHDALPISVDERQDAAEAGHDRAAGQRGGAGDRKSTRLNSSHVSISYAVFCLKKKKKKKQTYVKL